MTLSERIARSTGGIPTECPFCGDPSPEHDPIPCHRWAVGLGNDIYGEPIVDRAMTDARRAGTLSPFVARALAGTLPAKVLR